MVPTVALPPAAPFTSHVTFVVVETVEFESVIVAVNVVCSLSGRLATEVGVIATDLMFVEPPPPLPHPATHKVPATANKKAAFRSLALPAIRIRRACRQDTFLTAAPPAARRFSPGTLLIIARFSPNVPTAHDNCYSLNFNSRKFSDGFGR